MRLAIVCIFILKITLSSSSQPVKYVYLLCFHFCEYLCNCIIRLRVISIICSGSFRWTPISSILSQHTVLDVVI